MYVGLERTTIDVNNDDRLYFQNRSIDHFDTFLVHYGTYQLTGTLRVVQYSNNFKNSRSDLRFQKSKTTVITVFRLVAIRSYFFSSTLQSLSRISNYTALNFKFLLSKIKREPEDGEII